MAKKKTVENIKAAPVLRGEDPTPETPVITKSYSVRDDWKDINKVNYVAFKSVDGEVQDLTVNGEPAGGGGGVIQAKITFNIEVTEGETVDVTYDEMGASGFVNGALYGAHLDPNKNSYYVTNPMISYTFSMTHEESFIIIAPQTFAIRVSNGDITSVSGNATWSEGDTEVRNITGDCSITISA